jgi:hypothetical protein
VSSLPFPAGPIIYDKHREGGEITAFKAAHNSGGKLLKLFSSKESDLRLVSLLISGGISFKLFPCKSKLSKLVRLPISGGRLLRLF